MANYIEIISAYYPNCFCHVVGDTAIYENIIWDSGDSIPAKSMLDTIDLDLRRQKAWDEVKAYRDARKFGGIYVSGKWFHNDPDSRTQWLGLKDKARDVLANGGTSTTSLTINHPTYGVVPIQWNAMDNALVLVTVQLAFDIVEKTGDLDGTLYGVGQYHKAQIYASATPETYNYKVGWPPVFGE